MPPSATMRARPAESEREQGFGNGGLLVHQEDRGATGGGAVARRHPGAVHRVEAGVVAARRRAVLGRDAGVEAAALVGRAGGRRSEEARDPGLAECPADPLALGGRAEVEDHAPRAADGVGDGREAVAWCG